MIFKLDSLNSEQRRITQEAIDAITFDLDLLKPKLLAEKGRDYIPVEWTDLSRYAQAKESHEHKHEHRAHGGDHEDFHVLAAEIEGRRAALGLAWYSGKISIEQSLVNNPDLAKEVFVAEGAHMIDFFYMTDEHRKQIFAAYHQGDSSTDHGHGWFEETGNDDYWSWVGESFMSGFLHAYAGTLKAPLEARQPWVHKTTPDIAAQIRQILTPAPDSPAEPTGYDGVYVGSKHGKLYHMPDCPKVARIKHRTQFHDLQPKHTPCSKCKPDTR